MCLSGGTRFAVSSAVLARFLIDSMGRSGEWDAAYMHSARHVTAKCALVRLTLTLTHSLTHTHNHNHIHTRTHTQAFVLVCDEPLSRVVYSFVSLYTTMHAWVCLSRKRRMHTCISTNAHIYKHTQASACVCMDDDMYGRQPSSAMHACINTNAHTTHAHTHAGGSVYG
jgi:hypothetical protein